MEGLNPQQQEAVDAKLKKLGLFDTVKNTLNTLAEHVSIEVGPLKVAISDIPSILGIGNDPEPVTTTSAEIPPVPLTEPIIAEAIASVFPEITPEEKKASFTEDRFNLGKKQPWIQNKPRVFEKKKPGRKKKK